jgi:hypothetical protein
MAGYESNHTPTKRAVLHRHRLPQALQRLLRHRRQEHDSGASLMGQALIIDIKGGLKNSNAFSIM